MSSLWLGSKWKQQKMEESLSSSIGSETTSLKEKEKGKDKEKEKEKEIEYVEKSVQMEETDKGETNDTEVPELICHELLWSSILEGNYERVELLVTRYNHNPNKRTANGSTALHLAAWRGFLAIALCLLENGADVNARQDKTGWTALHLALRFGHEEVAEALISAGAAIDALDSYGCSSMTFAALGGKVGILEFLISQKLDVNHLPQGNGKEPLPPGYDCPPLHTVCALGHMDMVECLIVEGKADVNRRDSVNRTPLMYAVRGNQVEVIKFLLKQGVKMNLCDAKGKTAMHHAAKRGDMEIIDLLLNAKADIYALDNEGLMPLDRLKNDEDGAKRAHMVEMVERRKRRVLQNVLYTSAVGLATGVALYFGK